MARVIANFLDLNLTDEELNEILSQKHAMINARDWGKEKAVAENGAADSSSTVDARKTALKISKFQGVLGDWVNYFSPEQTRRLDEMIRFKFESQELCLTDDATMAIRRINKLGRLVESRAVPAKAQHSDMSSANGDTSTWARAKSNFRKKPIFTKAEAVFIRKKDKVFIVEERYQPDGPLLEQSSLWKRIFCCCCTNRPGYTPF